MRNYLILLVVILIAISIPVFAQEKMNLTGTWMGETLAEGPDIDIILTLVIEHKNDGISGQLKDDMGFIDSEITDAKLDKNILTFKSLAQTPDGDVGMTFKLTVTGNEMKGDWEAEDGVFGSWTAKRQEPKKKE